MELLSRALSGYQGLSEARKATNIYAHPIRIEPGLLEVESGSFASLKYSLRDANWL